MVMDTVTVAYRTKTDVFPLDAGTLKSLHNLIQIGLHQHLILCAVRLIDWRTSVQIKPILFGVIAILLFTSRPALTHHSFAAEYDANKHITLKGKITKVEFLNPHSWIHIDVKDSTGKVVNWAVEMGSPNTLIRHGFNKNSVPAGTEVTVEGYHAKDGSPTANAREIKLADGKRLFAGSSAPDAPTEEPK